MDRNEMISRVLNEKSIGNKNFVGKKESRIMPPDRRILDEAQELARHYHYIFKRDDGKLTILDLPFYEIDDYDENRFFKKDNTPIRFNTRETAKTWLNANVKKEMIDESLLESTNWESEYLK